MKRMVLCVGGFILLLAYLYGCAGVNGKSVETIDTSDSAWQKSIAIGAPSILKLVIVPNGFKLNWKPSPDDPDKVSGYEIVRAEFASGPFTKIATVDKGASQYIDETASPENIYYYKVRAVAGTVYSPYSNTVTGER
jgi:hypothetical protein